MAGKCYIRNGFFNGQSLSNDMATHTGAELLAELLGSDTSQASLLLDRFAGGMAATLLGSGRLALEGLGTFSVAHDHAARETTGRGAVFNPPKERIVFDPRLPARGDASRIAVERLGMSDGEAVAFAKAMSSVFGRYRAKGGDVELRGFGLLSASRSVWTFTPDKGLEELLNSLYEGLKGIEMPDRAAVVPARGGRSFLKPAGIAVALAMLGIAGFFVIRQLPLEGSGKPDPVVVQRTTAPAPPDEGMPPSPAVAPVSAALPDSVVLGKGRYTVIAATFTSLKTSREEARRLSGLGHRIMIWPVHSDGHRYFRLVEGDFAGFREAHDSLKSMPAGLSKNVYIQQAYKNVVIYGEQGL